MESVVSKYQQANRKTALPQVKSGDTVRVHQKIREAGKDRVQIFEGTVIKTRRMGSITASMTVRRLSSGVGVEKTYLLHSPNIEKIQILKRGKVRRNYLTYLRERQGKATRLTDVSFDKEAVNVKEEAQLTAENQPSDTKEVAEVKTAEAVAKAEAKTHSETGDQPEVKTPPEDDKAASKKAKAEAFRKAQEAKQK